MGLGKANDLPDLHRAVREALQYDGQVLVERFVRATEIHVGLLDGRVLGAIEVAPKHGLYDYKAKYTAGLTEYICPPRVAATRLRGIMNLAERAVCALSCTGACRVDLLVTEGENEYVLEVNTLPGLTATSLLPKIAASAGIDYPSLCETIVKGARLHAGLPSPASRRRGPHTSDVVVRTGRDERRSRRAAGLGRRPRELAGDNGGRGLRSGTPDPIREIAVLCRRHADSRPSGDHTVACLFALRAKGGRALSLGDQGFEDPLLRLFGLADQQDVAAGGDGLNGGVLDAVVLCNGMHFRVIRDDEASAEPLAECAYGWAERASPDDRDRETCRRRAQSSRWKLPRRWPREGTHSTRSNRSMECVTTGKSKVRVEQRVAVSGKVLCRGHDARLLQSANPSHAKACANGGIASKRAIADDRILGMRVDVDDGSKIERDARRGKLRADGFGQPFGQGGVEDTPNGVHRRDSKKRGIQTGQRGRLPDRPRGAVGASSDARAA